MKAERGTNAGQEVMDVIKAVSRLAFGSPAGLFDQYNNNNKNDKQTEDNIKGDDK